MSERYERQSGLLNYLTAALVVIKKMVSAMTAAVCPTLCGNERTDAIANYGTDDKGHHYSRDRERLH
jgi:hypothetical protein